MPLKPTRLIILLILVAGLVAACMNFYLRHSQYQKWQENSQIFYLDDGTPLFTTTDAPYFLGLAQAIKRDGYFHQFNGLRHYPHIANHYEENPPNSNLRKAPLLSVVLSLMASDSSTKSLLEAGHRLIPISALLTSFMIIFAFGATGLGKGLLCRWRRASLAHSTFRAGRILPTTQVFLFNDWAGFSPPKKRSSPWFWQR